jgi:putative oxidoreductase
MIYKTPFTFNASFIFFRIVVSLLLIIHGLARWYVGGVVDFGNFLNMQGFPFGMEIAWFLTISEIVGGAFMAIGFMTAWVAIFFVLQLLVGIFLVHGREGWFVVGYGRNGSEYSVLLIVSLLLIISNQWKNNEYTDEN